GGRLENSGAIAGDLALSDGRFENSGLLDGDVTQTGGRIINSGDILGDLALSGGRTDNNGTLTGAMAVSGTGILISSGETTGAITLDADGRVVINATGVQTGAITQTAGLLRNAGTIDGDLALSGGRAVTTNTVIGDITQTGGTLRAEGTIVGDVVVDAGLFTVTGDLVQTGLFLNAADLVLESGRMSVSGDVGNLGRLTLQHDTALQANELLNAGLIRLGATGPAGSRRMTIDSDVVGFWNGDLGNPSGGILDLRTGAIGDQLTVNGNISGATLVLMDVDMVTRVSADPSVGTLDVDGTLAGDLTIQVNLLGPDRLQSNPITLISSQGFEEGFNLGTLQGVPLENEVIIYRLRSAEGNITLSSGINPALGGVAAAFDSVQNLLGAVINRPSGAYTTGAGFESANNCRTGTWARVVGGRASAESLSFNNADFDSVSRGRIRFSGIQGGIDFGCLDSAQEWDVTAGLLFGRNTGSITQRSDFTLPTTGDFDQLFAGVYVAATRGNWGIELQARSERGDFEFSNRAFGLADSRVSTRNATLSGRLAYRSTLSVDDTTAVYLTPTVGFSVSRSQAGALTFELPRGGGSATLQSLGHTSRLAYIGVDLTRTRLLSETSALTLFTTATAYRDFSAERRSEFTLPGGTDVLRTQNMGTYGEVGLGLNYVRLFGGSAGPLQQMDVGLRADYRFSSRLRSPNITAQVRLTF
ncbi:MAG: hypothetical protein ACK4GT_12490, partial [Pararhodobacter sp.]